MKKIILILILFAFVYQNTVNAQTCSCHQLLDSLIRKVESDYAGYIHKVKEPGNPAYEKLIKSLKIRSEKVSYEDCYKILDSYTQFFKDGHLFVTEFPKYTPAQADSLSHLIKYAPVSANYLNELGKKANRDSVEGIWKDASNQQIAIVKQDENHFWGVIQQSNIPKWSSGMVKFELEKINPNQYNITYYRNDFAKIHFCNLHIYKNVFLGFGPYRLAKIYPHHPEIEYVNQINPILPVIKIIDRKNILLTIPSALIDGKYLDSLLAKYDAQIKSTPNLIVDIRGNLGGNFIWGNVYDIANTIAQPIPKPAVDDDYRMLASADNADYVKNRIAIYYKKDSLANKFYQNLMDKINQNLGKTIGFSYYSSAPDTAARKVYKYPSHIAIITDKGVASAAEAFIMGMKENSSKIIMYGSNTYGMIDYMNVNTIQFGGKGNTRYYFGYPFLFSKDIKTNPNNPTGLKPDVYIAAKNMDWVEWVVKDLNKKYMD